MSYFSYQNPSPNSMESKIFPLTGVKEIRGNIYPCLGTYCLGPNGSGDQVSRGLNVSQPISVHCHVPWAKVFSAGVCSSSQHNPCVQHTAKDYALSRFILPVIGHFWWSIHFCIILAFWKDFESSWGEVRATAHWFDFQNLYIVNEMRV